MKKITFLFAFCFFAIVTNAQQFRWAKGIAGTSVFSVDIKNILPRNGVVYICGKFTGTVDFDPQSGTSNVTNLTANGTEGFIARYDGDGELVWAKKSDIVGDDEYIDMVFGLSDAYRIVCLHKISTNTFRLVDINTETGDTNFISANQVSTGTIEPKSFVQNNDKYFVVGGFTGSLTQTGFNNSLISAGASDAFIIEFRKSGQSFLRSSSTTAGQKAYGGSGNEIFNHVDFTSNYLSLSGSFTANFSYDSGQPMLTNNGGKDGMVFIHSYDDSAAFYTSFSNVQVKAYGIGASGDDEVLCTSFSEVTGPVTNSTLLYVGGYFSGTTDFNPDTAVTNSLTSSGGTDGFLARYNVPNILAFNYEYANRKGGALNDKLVKCNVRRKVIAYNNSLVGHVHYAYQRSNAVLGNYITFGGYDQTGVDLPYTDNITAQSSSTTLNVNSAVCLSDLQMYLCGSFNGTTQFDSIGSTALLTPISGGMNGFIHKMEVCANSANATTISSSENLCSGKNIRIYTNGGLNNNAKWVWRSGSCSGPVVGEGSSILVSPSTTTTYYYTGEGGCMPSGNCSAGITVNVLQTPIANVALSGNTLTASSSGAVSPSYIWYNCTTGTVVAGNNTTYTPTVSGDYKVRVTSSNGCFDETSCITVTVLSTEDFSKLGVKLFPNPVQDSFTIQGEVVLEKLGIYNLLGQQVKMFAKPQQNTFSIVDLPQGTYVIKLQTEKGVANTKIIKQ